MEERRRFDRYTIDIPVRIEVLESAIEGRRLDVKADNLSAGGLFFRSEGPLALKSLVKVELLLSFDELQTPMDPEGRLVISVTGSVQRSDDEGTAIAFHEDYDTTCFFDFMQVNESASQAD